MKPLMAGVLMSAVSFSAEARTWYVNASSTSGSPNGSSWARAYTNVQSAVTSARFSDEIWVANGTYYPGPNRNTSFNLKAGVALYGGFAGTETTRTNRDWAANPTILSGDVGQTGVATDNVYVVVAATNASGAVLDGFTIADAYSPVQADNAHGILINSPITVRNCRVENNTGYYGGGLYNQSTCRVSNCFFLNNLSVNRGGAIRTEGVMQELFNCVFAGNRCDNGSGVGQGGAIAAHNNPITIVNCSFASNSAASYGQAIYLSSSVTGTVLNCILWDSGDYGGGVRPRDDSPPYALGVSLSYCDVRDGWKPLNPDLGHADHILADDPLFVDAPAYNFMIASNSPCKDAGTPTNASPVDIVGQPRPQGSGVDLGAYEVPQFTERYRVTFQSVPPGRQVAADGMTAATPAEFQLTAGSHIVSAASPQDGGGGARYLFAAWSDDGAQSHEVSVTGDTSFTVLFTTQYQWNVSFQPVGPGSVVPASGSWYESSTTITATVTTQWGWDQVAWSGTLDGCTVTGKQVVVPMDRPRFLTAVLSRANTNLPPGGWKFVATGDGRGTSSSDLINTNINREIIQRTIAEQADLLIYSGDLVYAGGVSAFQAWTNLWAPLYQAGIGVYVGPGNHDLGAGWSNAFSYLPTNGPPGEIGYTYTVENKNALFVSLDEYDKPMRVAQAWLDAVLEANTNLHVFAFGHAAAFMVYHYDCLDDWPTERNTFWRSLIAARCRVYFCGHDHFYDHARIDDNDGNLDNDVHQFIVGTAGAPFYTDPGGYYGVNGPYTPYRVLHEKQYGYVVGEVVSNTVTLLWMRRIGTNAYECNDVFVYTAAPPPPTVKLTVPASATEGDGLLAGQGEVVLPAPAGSNVTITLLSSSPAEISVTNSLIIQSNQTSAVFDLQVIDDALLDGSRPVTITATANGWKPANAAVALHDDETATLSLRIPASAREGDGRLAGAGDLSINTPPDKAVSVSLSSDDTTEILLPESMTLPAGQTNATFDITVIDDGAIDGTKTAAITAHVQNWTSGTAAVEVIDNENTNLSLTLPASVNEGDGLLTDAGRVTIAGTLATGVVVTLSSSDPALLQVPATADIGSEETLALFPLQVVDDHLFQTTRTVTISATAPGFGAAEATVSVINDDLGMHYVALSGSSVYPYKDWSSAATDIQTVADAVTPGSTIVVAGGRYALTGELAIAKALTLRSARDGQSAVLDAQGRSRVLRLADPQAVVDGFRIEGGFSTNGAGAFIESGTMMNCILSGNAALNSGGGVHAASGARIYNCTIVSNAAAAGGGILCDGPAWVQNTIIYFNSAQTNANWRNAGSGTNYLRCCSTPAPPDSQPVTADPRFVDLANGNLHLQSDSPCIDAGAAASNVVADFDGTPRPLDGNADGTNSMDIGAVEFVNATVDSDRDGMLDSAELLAGTSPTDPLSVLRIEDLWLAAGGSVTPAFAWKTVTGHLYTVLTTTNLLTDWTNANPAWIDVLGMGGALAYTNAGDAASRRFFRVGVRQQP